MNDNSSEGKNVLRLISFRQVKGNWSHLAEKK